MGQTIVCTIITFAYTDLFENLKFIPGNISIFSLWTQFVSAGALCGIAGLDIILLRFENYYCSLLIFVVGNFCIVLDFIKFRSQINAQFAKDKFYRRLTKVLQISIIFKYVFLIAMFIVSAVLFITDITFVPFVIHVVISTFLFAIQLAIFIWISFKVNRLLTQNPPLKLVRTKVCLLQIVSHFRF